MSILGKVGLAGGEGAGAPGGAETVEAEGEEEAKDDGQDEVPHAAGLAVFEELGGGQVQADAELGGGGGEGDYGVFHGGSDGAKRRGILPRPNGLCN